MTIRRAAFLSFCVLSLAVAVQGDALAAKAGRRETGGTQGKMAARDNTAVARWGDVSIPAYELKEYIVGRAGRMVRQGLKISPESARALLIEMIGQRILKAEAGKDEILNDPRFKGAYAIAAAREVADRYVKEVLRDRFAVTDNEVAAAMPKHRNFARIKQVVVQTREEAEQVLDNVRAGMSFDDAIEKYSTVRAAQGATVNVWEEYDLMGDEARDAILRLKQGELSGIIPIRIGYCIALAAEKRVMTDEEWNALFAQRRSDLFSRKAEAHNRELMRGVNIESFDRELMLAAGEDFEFQTSRRVVMTVDGEKVFFDDFVRSRDSHLRDKLKINSSEDLFKSYRVEFQNLAVIMRLAKAAAAEKGWTEPEGKLRDKVRESIAMKVLGERLFEGVGVSDEEVRKEYDDHADAFTIKKRYKVRRLTFPTVDAANKFRKSVKSPEDFYSRMRSLETKDDRYQNVYYEWKNIDRLDEKTKKAFGKTKKGKLTEPIEAPDKQQHVYFIDDIENNYRIPFKEVRLNIKKNILRQRQEVKISGFVDAEISAAVKFYDASIRTVSEQINAMKKHRPLP